MDYALGIDIGGTNTVFGIIDKSGNVLKKKSILTFSQDPVKELLDRLFHDVCVWESEIKDEVKLAGIGIGAPNGNYHTGMINPNPPNLGTSWDSLDLVETVKHYRNVPVIVTNDANAAALGEMHFGAAKGMRDFVVITLGTGLGSGIVVNGNLLYGHDGSAGELGHIILEENGPKCKCGKSGCLEMYVSAKGLDRAVKEFKNNHPDDKFLAGLPDKNVNGKEMDDAYDRGEDMAIEIYSYIGSMLGKGLAQAAILLSPEAFIFYGGISKAGERILKTALNSMNENILDQQKGRITLKLSELPDGDACILGATSLIWDGIKK